MAQLAAYGEETWFRLGDRDLATHIARTARLRAGARLTDVVPRPPGVARDRGRGSCRWPTSRSRTEVRTDDGWLEFQEYFVHRRQAPEVREVRFAGVEDARADARGARGARGRRRDRHRARRTRSSRSARSSPCPGCARRSRRHALARRPGRRGQPDRRRPALKGPADRMLASLGHEASALGVARLYADLADVFVLDTVDAALAAADRGARAPRRRHRHDHDRRPVARPPRRDGARGGRPALARLREGARRGPGLGCRDGARGGRTALARRTRGPAAAQTPAAGVDVPRLPGTESRSP